MHALIHAVEEINADPDLLPNVTLGFQVFDSCNTLRRAAQATLSMLSGEKKMTPNYHCNKGTPFLGIIGDSASTRSILMAHILGLYRYPLISYFATNPILSDRVLFPSFFRTIPSDEFQMKGLAQLISHFGWSWLGLLATDDDYGQFGLQMAKQEIMNSGACLAFIENILTSRPDKNAPHIVKTIKESSAKVIVVISPDSGFVFVAEELLRQNVAGNIWIATEGWATSDLLSVKRFHGILLGTVGFAIHHGQMPMFDKYLSNLHPSRDVDDPFIGEIWEQIFICKWLNKEQVGTLNDNVTSKACTENGTVGRLLSEKHHRLTFNVYTGVYAIAWALQSLLNCKTGNGPFHHGTCSNISSFKTWHLLHYIKNVTFKTQDGRQVFFDRTGNPPPIYDIVNWQTSSDGALEKVTLGRYDANNPDGRTFNLQNTEITWINNGSKVPISKCSLNCPSGFYKVIVPEKPLCCYECAQCPQGHISNQTDATECLQCSWDMWPNLQQDRCAPRTSEFLAYEKLLGGSLAALSIFSFLNPLFILGVFIHYKKTPIIRANNYSLSCLLLVSLSFCFLCCLAFIGYPTSEMCLLRQVAFGVVFTLCISCVLGKTIIVVIAFNATKPGSRLKKWAGVKMSYSIIVFCVLTQLCLCLIWLIFFPPFSELDLNTKPGVIIVICNEGLSVAFWCMLGYLGLLAAISFIVAFMARRLPDSFNEAKFITFSMLAFLSVWVSFIPAYLSAQGMYTTAMEVFAILTSSWAVLSCIFLPKCVIVLLKPNLNTRENVMGKGGGKNTTK